MFITAMQMFGISTSFAFLVCFLYQALLWILSNLVYLFTYLVKHMITSIIFSFLILT